MNVRRAMALVAFASCGIVACGGQGDDRAREVDASSTPAIESDTSAPQATVPDKSGGTTSESLVITLANENDEAAGEAPGIKEFARLVETLSNGSIRVDIHWRARETDDVFTKSTQAVRTGQVDMAFVGNNYWGYEDVMSTQAAQAPLLIRSFAQGVAVSEDADLVTRLFTGLDDIGVVGLEMFPEDFKVLVDFQQPVISAADLDGRVLQARAAPELYEFFESLGTTPQQQPAQQPQLRVVPPWLQREFTQGTVVGNLPIYFVYFDLVANEQFWNDLDDQQRHVLIDAAAAAQDFAVAQQTEQRSLDFITAYCARGSAVNALDAAGVAGFEAAARPAVDRLRTDPLAAELIDRIEQLGEGLPATVYPVCTHEGGPDVEFPDGVYRFEVTDDDLRAAAIDREEWSADTGVYTFTMRDGTFTWTQQSDTDTDIDATAGAFAGGGTYEVSGNTLTTIETQLDPNVPITTELTWAVNADGTLTFKIVNATRSFPRILYGEPWIRIGDA